MIVLEKMSCDVERLLHKPEHIPPELQVYLKDGLTFYRKLKIAHDTVWLYSRW